MDWLPRCTCVPSGAKVCRGNSFHWDHLHPYEKWYDNPAKLVPFSFLALFLPLPIEPQPSPSFGVLRITRREKSKWKNCHEWSSYSSKKSLEKQKAAIIMRKGEKWSYFNHITQSLMKTPKCDAISKHIYYLVEHFVLSLLTEICTNFGIMEFSLTATMPSQHLGAWCI